MAIGTDFDTDTTHLTMPDPKNTEEMWEFVNKKVWPLATADKRGAKTLARSLEQYMKLCSHAEKHLERATKNLNTLNGIRTPAQKTGDKSRSLRHAAEQLYGKLDTKGLRQHCSLFSLVYENFESIDEVITALVEKQVELQTT